MEQAVVQVLIELALQSGGSVLESPHQTLALTGHTLCTAKAAGQRGSSLLIFAQPDIFLILRRVGTFRVEGWGRICGGFQGIFVGAKQLQPALAEIAAYVHDHNLCVLTLWMEEPEAFQRNLAGDN